MSVDFDDLIALWGQPVPAAAEDAHRAFAAVYSDPLTVNGTLMPLADLIDRARGTQRAFADLSATLLARSDTPTHTTLVFRMRGRHVGPLPSPVGEIPATGKISERQIIDLLTITDGRISEVWMVGDELGALLQLGALSRSTTA
jgi:hypothetical protein